MTDDVPRYKVNPKRVDDGVEIVLASDHDAVVQGLREQLRLANVDQLMVEGERNDLQQRVEALERELNLVHEAVNDSNLTDAVVRVIAGGVDKVTQEDIKWAQNWINQHK